ncbi:hypothetical protein VOLCADRAFT_59353 [Volvox carteri f. nagariensis]|uniref:Enoyl reductase (ER) domain-containing protein n=1 Tax=Volvox carteri f. nagariensis TaxID=3068 RepID=D8TSN8_VOLCA|nr:uncharacterized protein VOLCADRAFT_59353 [Volvox carteri f. nagariensis]EFJ49520.1 hypothetical protein VOLCADRAFT_59353 [Volvox carteri f. nagariensis]|eukprot:XP_002949501.1 hypothetical protein VOLCADRAFT_59353 [Volvox carteri f. nagariensis]
MSEPKLVPGTVRIQVVSASLNFPDALQIKGEYQDKPKLPFVPGSEVSGVVVEVAAGVKNVRVGDKVCAVRQGGAFAEQVVAPAASVWLVPDGVPVQDAAAIPIVYGTADLALRHRAQLKAGQTVLILGAAGGVGLAALQLALLAGARVVAVARGAAKAQFLRAQGGDVVVVDTEALLAAEPAVPLHTALRAAAPKGVDVVFDPVGGSSLFEALKVVTWGAQYLVIGFAGGDIPKVPANLLLVKNVTMHGVFWGSYMSYRPKVLAESMQQVLKWFGEGRLRVEVYDRYPMERVTEAFAAILDRRVRGKVLLTMGAGPALSKI